MQKTPWIELYTEKNGDFVARIPYDIFDNWPATDREYGAWTAGWMGEYLPFYYAEFGDFRWAVVCTGDTILGTARKNVATSKDGGETWDIGSYRADYGGNLVSGITFLDENTAYMSFYHAAEHEPTSGPAVSVTTDGGKTWKKLTFSLPAGMDAYRMTAGTPGFTEALGRWPVQVYDAYGLLGGTEIFSTDKTSWYWDDTPCITGVQIPNPATAFVDKLPASIDFARILGEVLGGKQSVYVFGTI